MLDLALDVIRHNDGLFNSGQLAVYEPLLKCYHTLDRPADLRRAQHYVLLIHQAAVGQNDPRLLAALDEAAHRYEEIGLYLSARRLHRRAIDILRGTAVARGAKLPNDLRLVTPLRGMARAFRLEYAYGLALPDFAELETETSDLRSRATFDTHLGVRLDPLGRRSLEHAVDILRSHPDADRKERLDTLLELGDWYQLAGIRRGALRTYRDYWHEYTATATVADAVPDADLVDEPVPLMARPATGRNLRRAPLDAAQYRKCTVDFEFTVTRSGWVKDVIILESNAPKDVEEEAARELQLTRYRPRFLNGEPVDTPGLHHRQDIYVRRPPSRDIRAAYHEK